MLSFAWAPKGWALCDGSSMPVMQNQALYSLFGVTYGGNGVTTFNLPDFRGRVPVGAALGGATYPRGQQGGAETVALTLAQVPPHTHAFNATAVNTSLVNKLQGNMLADTTGVAGMPAMYAPPPASVALNGDTVVSAGGGAAHNNVQPFTVINFCVALSGIYPSRP